MSKAPAFQFYPGDWLRDEVSGCSLEAQGLWLRMIMIMHDAQVYGQLILNNAPMSPEFIAKKVGISPKKYLNLLEELEFAGVINRKENGVIFSGRMERDERARQKNRARQDKHRENRDDESNGDVTPLSRSNNGESNASVTTPSSSSSSSSLDISNDISVKTKQRSPRKTKTSTTLPEDFTVTEEMQKWFAEKCPRLDLGKELEKFKNRCIAKGTEYKDWAAGWRTQMLNAEEWFKPDVKGGGFKADSYDSTKDIMSPDFQQDPPKPNFSDDAEFFFNCHGNRLCKWTYIGGTK